MSKFYFTVFLILFINCINFGKASECLDIINTRNEQDCIKKTVSSDKYVCSFSSEEERCIEIIKSPCNEFFMEKSTTQGEEPPPAEETPQGETQPEEPPTPEETPQGGTPGEETQQEETPAGGTPGEETQQEETPPEEIPFIILTEEQCKSKETSDNSKYKCTRNYQYRCVEKGLSECLRKTIYSVGGHIPELTEEDCQNLQTTSNSRKCVLSEDRTKCDEISTQDENTNFSYGLNINKLSLFAFCLLFF